MCKQSAAAFALKSAMNRRVEEPDSEKNSMKVRRATTFGAVLVSCALAFTAPLFAGVNTDVLVMKNGDHLTCRVKGLDQGVLYVSLDYVIQTISVDWKKVERIESNQLFIVKAQDGTVYRGKLRTAESAASQPVKIEVLEVPTEPVTLEQSQVIALVSTSEKFWQRFNGALNLGVIYTKGNQQTQYSFGSQTEYLRERWSAEASFNSNLSSSTGTSASTRNVLDLSGTHLWGKNNYYSGLGSFLQSSAQGINLQTTAGGGVGHFFKNTDKIKFSVLGGAGWIRTEYEASVVPIGRQNLATAVIVADLKAFRFNKTNLSLTATLLPAVSDPGRVLFNTNASYYIKLISNLSWNVSFYGNWDNQPPSGLSGSDYGSSSGLTWTFGLK
jgi:Protein of unknown function, DUF481